MAGGRGTYHEGVTKPLTIIFQKEDRLLKGTATLFTSDYGITILKDGRSSNKVLVDLSLYLF